MHYLHDTRDPFHHTPGARSPAPVERFNNRD
jgi:hypothetical protein